MHEGKNKRMDRQLNDQTHACINNDHVLAR